MRSLLVPHNETKRRLQQHDCRIPDDPARYNKCDRPHGSSNGAMKRFKPYDDPIDFL